jgi:hypothetical protein
LTIAILQPACMAASRRVGLGSGGWARAAGAGLPSVHTSWRGLSTEPVLQNSAVPEMPKAPIPKPPQAAADGSPQVTEKVEKLCNEILDLNMMELSQLLKGLKVSRPPHHAAGLALAGSH